MDFTRIAQTINVEVMQRSHVTIVGGAYGLARDLVRCGLGSLTMVDFDVVDRSNPARQDLYITDLGRAKVEATAADLRRINPEVDVDVQLRDFCEITQEEFDTFFGHTDLFVCATDFFPAQARGNREALRLQKPSVWIGLYREGRAGEIIHYVPGITKACYRCICGERYRAFTSGNSAVGSEGATILDLRLVDAVTGFVCVGILTIGSDNRLGRLIHQLGNRNLLQVKIDPDYRLGDKDIFEQYLGSHPANFSFTTIAVPMEVDPSCPECCQLQSGEGAVAQ